MAKTTCSSSKCTNVSHCRGLCKAHYMRQWRHGDAEFPVKHQRRGDVCQLDGCERPHQALGWCQGHYGRVVATGEPGPVEFEEKTANAGLTCFGPECEDDAVSKGLCPAHYNQQRKGGPLKPKRKIVPPGGPCQVDHCEKPALSEGLCRTHYTRRRLGEENWDRPIKKLAPSGSGHLGKDGYRHLYRNGRRVFEHRWFAEQLLGRELEPYENIHHLNGDRADNRTDGPFRMDDRGRLISGNLDLWSSNQPAGQEIGPKLEWAFELIQRYGTPDQAAWAGQQHVHAGYEVRA